MKGPNPFVLWDEDPKSISGRKEEIRIFNSFLNATSSKQGSAMLIVGGPGMGKTTLLRHFSMMAGGSGLLAPYVKVERGESIGIVVDKLWQELRADPSFTHKGAAPEGLGGLVKAAADQERFGTVLLIDDIDNLKKAKDGLSILEETLRSSWGKRKVSFVLSSTRELRSGSRLVGTIELRPLEEHEARDIVEKALKKGPPKMGEECFQSIMGDTRGNPYLFKSVCHHIYDRLRDNEKVISKGHYLAYLPHIMSMLSRDWFGRMYQETPSAEKAILAIIAKNEDGMHVSDIAKALGKPLGPVTALIRRLLDRGQIAKIERGKYRIFARLYGKYVLQRS